jgi:hypothetical protein
MVLHDRPWRYSQYNGAPQSRNVFFGYELNGVLRLLRSDKIVLIPDK